ncbi:hypothetical protein HGRIS_010463 [Hohenbuehelia grisea]|uniref:Uncharacterized protein n=1 Tax=Hohenbuehelia grisea TaxID=104357 RepID=A0ABR3IZN5_9AGAR
MGADYHHSKQRKKRQEARCNGHAPSQRTLEVVTARASSPARADFDAAMQLPKAGAYGSKHEDFPDHDCAWELCEILDSGFTLIPWDGRTPRSLVDRAGRHIAVLAGQPADPSYQGAAQRAFDLMEWERQHAEFKPEEVEHRRSDFPAFATGILYGGGQPEPMRLVHGDTGTRGEMLHRFLNSLDLTRLAHFGDGA